MEDETVSALREIARLLERRVEQHEEQAARSEATRKRTEDSLARLRETTDRELPKALGLLDQDKQHVEEMKESRLRIEQRYEEQQRFQERLLEELERHNRLLERLVEKLGG